MKILILVKKKIERLWRRTSSVEPSEVSFRVRLCGWRGNLPFEHVEHGNWILLQVNINLHIVTQA